ncbi:MAG: O-antigen ligase family protein [Flavobacteriales bacterium]|nr:O-antigen ligase family protein [Flavobacteriales bacterium]MCB9447731.1 O-antigen ligase family protein [Flavobacteriales bacterium]
MKTWLQILRQQPWKFAVAALAFAIPSMPWFLPSLIVLIFVVTLWKQYYRQGLGKGARRKGLIVFPLFFLFHGIGLLYTQNMEYARHDLETKSALLFLPILMSWIPRPVLRDVYQVMLAYIAGCFTAMLECLGVASVHWLRTGENHFFYADLSLHQHTTYFALYVSLAIAMAYYFLLRANRSKKGKGFYAMWVSLVVVFSGFVLMLYSKAGMATMVMVHLITFAYFAKQRFGWWKTIVTMLLITVGSSVLIYVAVPHTAYRLHLIKESLLNHDKLDKTTVESTAVRVLVWHASKEVLKEHQPWGTGTGDVKDELLAMYKRLGMTGALKHELNSHNQYLQTWCALGIPGIVLLLLMLVYPFRRAIRESNYIYLVFLITFIFNLLSESMLEKQAGVVYFAFFNAFFFFWCHADRQPKDAISADAQFQ